MDKRPRRRLESCHAGLKVKFHVRIFSKEFLRENRLKQLNFGNY